MLSCGEVITALIANRMCGRSSTNASGSGCSSTTTGSDGPSNSSLSEMDPVSGAFEDSTMIAKGSPNQTADGAIADSLEMIAANSIICATSSHQPSVSWSPSAHRRNEIIDTSPNAKPTWPAPIGGPRTIRHDQPRNPTTVVQMCDARTRAAGCSPKSGDLMVISALTARHPISWERLMARNPNICQTRRDPHEKLKVALGSPSSGSAPRLRAHRNRDQQPANPRPLGPALTGRAFQGLTDQRPETRISRTQHTH
jgi:hypothetical protein